MKIYKFLCANYHFKIVLMNLDNRTFLERNYDNCHVNMSASGNYLPLSKRLYLHS